MPWREMQNEIQQIFFLMSLQNDAIQENKKIKFWIHI